MPRLRPVEDDAKEGPKGGVIDGTGHTTEVESHDLTRGADSFASQPRNKMYAGIPLLCGIHFQGPPKKHPPKMAPPKNSTATLDTGANFFQRGKKPSTAQRVVTAKKGTTVPVTLEPKSAATKRANYQEDGDEEEEEEDEIDDAEYSDEEHTSVRSDQEEEEEEDEDEHELIDDEIQSSDSDVVQAADLRKEIEMTTPLKESSATARKAEATQAKTARKKTAKTTYVAPYVGDIYAGFHQADLSGTEKLLRQFDLASKYGPCTELTRLERWERAFELGLNPPQDIKETLVAQMALNTPVFEGRV